MKRNSEEKRTFLIRLLLRSVITAALLALAMPLFSSENISISCKAEYTDKKIAAKIQAGELPRDTLKESLTDGHAAEIRFDLRLFRKRSGFSSVLGDSLIKEKTKIYRGMWNPVIKVYSVTFEENRTFFEDFSSFLQFFTATALSLSLLREDMQDFDNNYLLARVTVIPRVPEPPFTLLAPFLPDLSLSSPWEEVPLEYQGREE